MKIKWLARDTVRAPFMALCLSERAFETAAHHCNLKNPGQWLPNGNTACVHTWESTGRLTCVVCLDPSSVNAEPIAVASALVHEAVHVFQRLCDSIGEESPSREFEAYSIERIAERLMREFVRQTQ